MSDRIARMFERTRSEGRPAVIVFSPAGFPELDAAAEIAAAALTSGADAFEIGWPFSDPMADGPVNQVAYQRALENGATAATVLETARSVRARGIDAPLLVMGYANPLLSYGTERFVADAAAAGIDGLIVVDLPPHEAAELERPARAAGLAVVYLLAPTSTDERIAVVAEHAAGFIYCVSVTGVTGAREQVAGDLGPFLARVRSASDVPVAVGFGISTRAHVEAIGAIADGAVIGSAFVRMMADTPRVRRAAAIRDFLEEITGRESGHAPGAD